MISPYRQVISSVLGQEVRPGIGWTVLLASIIFPAAIGTGLYDYRIALTALIVIAGLGGLVLFYNVRTYSMVVLPIYYLFVFDRLLFGLAVLLIVTFLADRTNKTDFRITIPYPMLLSVLLLAGANGVVRAIDRDIGRYFFEFAFVIPIIVFIIYYNLDPSNSEIKSHLTMVVTATALIGWISLAQWVVTGVPRNVFRWDSQNTAGCFMGMVLPFTLISLIDSKETRSRIFWIIIFAGVLAGILVTQTRAVLVSLFVAFLYIASKDKRILKVLFPAIIVAGVALPGLIVYRLAMLLGVGDNPDWSSVGRIQIWTNSITYLPKYLLFGMGMDSFRTMYPADFPNSFIHAKHVHNVYLKWIFDLGIFGMVAYVAIIGKSLLRSMRAVKLSIEKGTSDQKGTSDERQLLLAINGGLISGMVASLVDATLHNTGPAIILWTLLAFLLVVSRRIESSVRVEESSVSMMSRN